MAIIEVFWEFRKKLFNSYSWLSLDPTKLNLTRTKFYFSVTRWFCETAHTLKRKMKLETFVSYTIQFLPQCESISVMEKSYNFLYGRNKYRKFAVPIERDDFEWIRWCINKKIVCFTIRTSILPDTRIIYQVVLE